MPPRVSDMLAVRIGQLTAEVFHLLDLQPCWLLRRLCHPSLPSRLRETLQTAGSPRSMGVTPLPRYYGPVRHPLVFDRLPGLAGYTTYLAPVISHPGRAGLHLLFRRDLPDASISLSLLPAYTDVRSICRRPSCFNVDPLRVGSVDAITAPPCGGLLHLPQGPSLRFGLCYPDHHHLIGPIRPTRGHIPTSSHCDVYEMPQLCGSA